MSNTAKHRPFDSGRSRLGTVYAKALLGAADAAGASDRVLRELDSFVNDVLDQLPKFEGALISPRVAGDEKERMLDRALAGKASPVFLNGLKVLSRHGRLDCLREVRDEFRKLYNEARNRVEVSVRTAAPLDSATLERIRMALKGMLGREIDIEQTLQPELLGGLVVRVGDTLFDGSLIGKLERLRTAALEGTTDELRISLERFIGA